MLIQVFSFRILQISKSIRNITRVIFISARRSSYTHLLIHPQVRRLFGSNQCSKPIFIIIYFQTANKRRCRKLYK